MAVEALEVGGLGNRKWEVGRGKWEMEVQVRAEAEVARVRRLASETITSIVCGPNESKRGGAATSPQG